MSNKYKKAGLDKLQEIIGESGDKIISTMEMISPEFARYIVDYAYGDLYQRNGITDKVRELAAVSNMMGQGVTGLPLKAHINGMLNVGWTKEEILEVIIFLTGYNGFPTCVLAIQTAHEVFQEKSI